LSRSAKNSKESSDGHGVREAEHITQHPYSRDASGVPHERRVRRADQRKYILVELVETEVGYAEHLRHLVQIYLPQLAALPIVTEAQRSSISRNLVELSLFHDGFSGRLVDVLREEHLGCESTLPSAIDEIARTERLSQKIGAVFVEEVGGRSLLESTESSHSN
jgi:hypothetical protein